MASDRENELAEIVKEFLVESKENLDHFELSLLEIEANPTAEKEIASLFRNIHSIKGSCSFLGFSRLETLTHAGESLLARARDGRLRLGGEAVGALLRLVDLARRLLRAIEEQGGEGELDVRPVVVELERLLEGSSSRQAEPEESGGGARPEDLRALAASDGKIRVDVLVLERLMNLVGELVLARNQLIQLAAASQISVGMGTTAQRLSLVTAEIQEAVMKMRMQPIGNIWSRFPRLVRDLARACNKLVRVELDGKDTELDKSIIEAIQDPLTHLVRNAVDHGIEIAEVRRQRGKAIEGCVSLRAFHEGGMVNIEVSDDGGGLDLAAVKRKALSKNLISADQAARMSDRELASLIFVPGFSTAEQVTNVSGRGVGMDVVKTNVEKLGGTVDVHPRPGQGTSIRIKIPLTLAIIPALIVTAAGDQFAIPQASLLEVVRLRVDDEKRQIELIQGTPVLRLRGKLLPLTYLTEELKIAARTVRESVAIVVLQADDRSFGLVVDEVNDTEEIVVKPLWKRLKGLACYAGATVLGDGHVALILDVIGLAQRVGVVGEGREVKTAHKAAPVERRGNEERILLCRMGTSGRLGIPLSKVARLEELPADQIERAGQFEVTQYRDRILPLIRVSNVLEERRSRPREQVPSGDASLHVVVYQREDRAVGLVVDAVLDIIEMPIALQPTGARAGVLGSMVVQEKVTEILDVEGAIRFADPTFFEPARAQAEG